MAVAWRIVAAPWSGDAFSGEGPRRYGGRWNSPGTAIVYTSAHQSLAALELLVHLDPESEMPLKAFLLEFDDGLVEQLSPRALPPDWRKSPPAGETMSIGDQWVREKRTSVLAVPSAIVPAETNFLLNPAHPDFGKIRIHKGSVFVLDPRLAA
jgi:RES domain-containing protein